jgi:hypothetical protein
MARSVDGVRAVMAEAAAAARWVWERPSDYMDLYSQRGSHDIARDPNTESPPATFTGHNRKSGLEKPV